MKCEKCGSETFSDSDQLPVAEEWLRSVGFVAWDHGGSAIHYEYLGQPCLLDVETDFSVMWVERHGTPDELWHVIPTTLKTRGDLRRLAAALGIELKERAKRELTPERIAEIERDIETRLADGGDENAY